MGDLGDVHVVQSRQMIEVQYVGLNEVRTQEEVAHDPAVVGDLVSNAEGAIQAQSSSNTMRLGADSANPLGYYLGITWVSPS